jgi:hypothetical protein
MTTSVAKMFCWGEGGVENEGEKERGKEGRRKGQRTAEEEKKD